MPVIDKNGREYEPSVWDIDDSELTTSQMIGNWICMMIAMGLFSIISFFRRKK